jgi:hypothetical protein
MPGGQACGRALELREPPRSRTWSHGVLEPSPELGPELVERTVVHYGKFNSVDGYRLEETPPETSKKKRSRYERTSQSESLNLLQSSKALPNLV